MKFKSGDRVRISGRPSGSVPHENPLTGTIVNDDPFQLGWINPTDSLYYLIRLDIPLQMDEGHLSEQLEEVWEDEDNLESYE